MLGFIHITKTGGTNLKDKNKNNEVQFGSYHYENALYYKIQKMKCFAILRHPVERYTSLFYYNTRGSEKAIRKKVEEFINKYNINDFVNFHYKDRNMVHKYENGWQFKKQVDWLKDADLENTYIIKFNKKNLINSVRELYKLHNIDLIYNDESKPINISNKQKFVPLTESSKNKIKEMYKEDLLLFKKLNNLNKPFCSLKELLDNK